MIPFPAPPPVVATSLPGLSAPGLQMLMILEGHRRGPEGLHRIYWLNGSPQIGYGHKLRPEEVGAFTRGISEGEARRLMVQDVLALARHVDPVLRLLLRPCEWDAALIHAYQVGAGAFHRGPVRAHLLAGDREAALSAWLAETRAEDPRTGLQVHHPGLVTRRQAEVRLFREGRYLAPTPPLPRVDRGSR